MAQVSIPQLSRKKRLRSDDAEKENTRIVSGPSMLLSLLSNNGDRDTEKKVAPGLTEFLRKHDTRQQQLQQLQEQPTNSNKKRSGTDKTKPARLKPFDSPTATAGPPSATTTGPPSSSTTGPPKRLSARYTCRAPKGLLVLGRDPHEAAGNVNPSMPKRPRLRQHFNFYEDGKGQWDHETLGIEGADTELKWEGIGTTTL